MRIDWYKDFLALQVAEVSGDTELFRFSVTDSNQTVYRLAAPSEEARQKWVSVLRDTIHTAASPKQSITGRPL